MVAQSLAVPGMLNVSVPAMLPMATKPALVVHGLPVFPRAAWVVIFSVLELPPFISGGLNAIWPFHGQPEGSQVTVPRSFTGFDPASAAPDPAVTRKSDSSAVVDTIRTIFRVIESALSV